MSVRNGNHGDQREMPAYSKCEKRLYIFGTLDDIEAIVMLLMGWHFRCIEESDAVHGALHCYGCIGSSAV